MIFNMTKIEDLITRVTAFRDDRDWKQFHNPKDNAIGLVLEASEVLELFQWKNKEEIDKYIKSHSENISDELADVMYWVLLMSHDLNIDIGKAIEKKLKKTEEKYPIEKSKGNHKKYTEL